MFQCLFMIVPLTFIWSLLPLLFLFLLNIFYSFNVAVSEGSLKVEQKNGGAKTKVEFLGNTVHAIRSKMDHVTLHQMLKKILNHRFLKFKPFLPIGITLV